MLLRRFQSLWRASFALLDILLSLLVFLLAYHLRFLPPLAIWFVPLEEPTVDRYLRVLPPLALVLLISNLSLRLYTPRREGSLGREFADTVKATLLTVVLFTTILFFDRSAPYSRGLIAIFAVLNPLSAFGFRATVRSVLRFMRRRGFNLRHIVIVGTGRSAQALIHRIRRNPWTGLRIIGLVGHQPEQVGSAIHGIPIIGTIENVKETLTVHSVDQVFIALPPHLSGHVEPLVRTCTDSMIDTRIVPDLGILLGLQYRTIDFDGIPIVSLWDSPISGWSAVAKRVMDAGLAVVMLVLAAPLFLVMAIGVRMTSKGPIFYRQDRMGLDGRMFRIWKFRTMRQGCEEKGVPGWTRPGDPRCTTFGRFLRRLSLDELPQLVNVLLGQMSLVGPRPERPVYIEKFKKSFPGYMLRHKVKAGITGWAQVNGWRGDTSLKKRIQFDLYYLQHWSLGFDLKILILTLLRGLAQPNAY